MDKLLAALAEKGVVLVNRSDEEIVKVAKSVGLDPVDFVERSVQVGPYKNKRDETNTFVKTGSYVVGRKENGRAETIRGMFVRAAAIDDMISDLQTAKELIAAGDVTNFNE